MQSSKSAEPSSSLSNDMSELYYKKKVFIDPQHVTGRHKTQTCSGLGIFILTRNLSQASGFMPTSGENKLENPNIRGSKTGLIR